MNSPLPDAVAISVSLSQISKGFSIRMANEKAAEK